MESSSPRISQKSLKRKKKNSTLTSSCKQKLKFYQAGQGRGQEKTEIKKETLKLTFNLNPKGFLKSHKNSFFSVFVKKQTLAGKRPFPVWVSELPHAQSREKHAKPLSLPEMKAVHQFCYYYNHLSQVKSAERPSDRK